MAKKYSLQHKDISAMIEAGISYGQHFCDEVINGYNTIEQIKNQSRKFMHEEWPVRKSKSNWLTAVSKLNILHFARNFE